MSLLFKELLLLFFVVSSCQGWILGRVAESKDGYSCFPWIFNPGCSLAYLINWDMVCRTNTLGWEMCDFREKKKDQHGGEEGGEEVAFKAEDVFVLDNDVLHELAEIEDQRETYSIIDQLVDETHAEDHQEIIQLSDVVLSETPGGIAQQLSDAVNASLNDFSSEHNLTSDVEFQAPSVFLPSSDPEEQSLNDIVEAIFDEEEETPEIVNLKPFTYNVNSDGNSATENTPPQIISLKPFKHIVKVVKTEPELQSLGEADELIDPRGASLSVF